MNDIAARALEAAKSAAGSNLATAIDDALASGVSLEWLTDTVAAIIGQRITLQELESSGRVAASQPEESRMVEVAILDHGTPTLDAMSARNAATIVLGPNRALRVHDDGLGWWVELTAQETAVLDSQGFIELEKAGFTIKSCE